MIDLRKGKIWKLSIVDLIVILLVIGALYAYEHKMDYFEIKGNDIYGASSTFHTLENAGYAVAASVKGHTRYGNLYTYEGYFIDSSAYELFLFTGNDVIVVGERRGRLTDSDLRADISPTVITLKPVDGAVITLGLAPRRGTPKDLGEGTEEIGEKIESSRSVSISFYTEFSGTYDFSDWLEKKIAGECSGDVEFDIVKEDSGREKTVLIVQNMLAEDLEKLQDNIREYLGKEDIYMSNIVVKVLSSKSFTLNEAKDLESSLKDSSIEYIFIPSRR